MTLPKDPIKAEEYRKKQSEITKKYFEDPKNREDASVRTKKRYEDDPSLIEKNRLGQIKRFQDPEQRRLAGLARKGITPSDATRKKMSESRMGDKNPIFGKHHSPEAVQKISDAATKQFEDPLQRQHLSELAIERFKDPKNRDVLRVANLGKHPSIQSRNKMSMSKMGNTNSKGTVPSESTRQKIREAIGKEKHYNWKGGVSFLPYCRKFDKVLKENVRSFFGNKCVLCGKTQEENGELLTVHHVFTEKMACCETKIEEMDEVRKRLPKNVARFGEDEFSEEEILHIRMMVPLCRPCHGKQNNKRERAPYEETTHRKFFVELILTKYGGKCYSEREV